MSFLLEKCKKYHHKFVEAPSYQGASLVAQMVKNPPAMWETWVQSLGWEDPLEEEYSCLENLHGQRSLMGYSP